MDSKSFQDSIRKFNLRFEEMAMAKENCILNFKSLFKYFLVIISHKRVRIRKL